MACSRSPRPEGFVLAQVDDDARPRPAGSSSRLPADGDYLVRAFAFPFVQESTIRFAGGPAYIYRLTLTVPGPFVDYPFPLAVSRGRAWLRSSFPVGTSPRLAVGCRSMTTADLDDDGEGIRPA